MFSDLPITFLYAFLISSLPACPAYRYEYFGHSSPSRSLQTTRPIHKIRWLVNIAAATLQSLWCACVQSSLVLSEGTNAIFRQSNHVYSWSSVFKVLKNIKKPAACDMKFVIPFLNARNMKPADIHRQLCNVYGEHTTSDSMVEMGETL
jgi:hypothetical protein